MSTNLIYRILLTSKFSYGKSTKSSKEEILMAGVKDQWSTNLQYLLSKWTGVLMPLDTINALKYN